MGADKGVSLENRCGGIFISPQGLGNKTPFVEQHFYKILAERFHLAWLWS